MGSYTILVLGGDGIGPEVTAEAVRALEAVAQRFGHHLALPHALVGQAAILAEGAAISDDTLARCHHADALLFGAVGGAGVGDPNSRTQPEQALLRLRKDFELYANLRPVQPLPALASASPLQPARLAGVDLLVVRELTGGLYFAQPSALHEAEEVGDAGEGGATGATPHAPPGEAWAVDTMVYSEGEIARIVRVAGALARQRRGLLTSVDKANVLSCSRLWRRVTEAVVRAEYPDVRLRHLLVDACAMALLRHPADFDVVVTENMFGDILTDEAAMLAGSLGLLPSASLGTRRTAHGVFGLYEPIHGSAPDIAGQGIANPVGAILSAALLLRHSLGLEREARVVEGAVRAVLTGGGAAGAAGGEDEVGKPGLRTADLVGGEAASGEAVAAGESASTRSLTHPLAPRQVTTQEMGAAIARRIASLPLDD